MQAAQAGFRVLATDRDGHRGRGAVTYRLDPLSCRFAEVCGDAEALLGFPLDEWCRPGFWLGRLHPDDREAAEAFCRSWSRDRHSHDAQYRMIDAAGRVVRVHDIVQVRDRGACQEIRGVIIDMADRMQSEGEAGLALRLQEQLLRIAAEELTRPVREISACAELLERHLAAQRDDVGGDHAIGIRSGVQRLDALLHELRLVAQGGGMSVGEIAESLSAIRAGQATRD